MPSAAMRSNRKPSLIGWTLGAIALALAAASAASPAKAHDGDRHWQNPGKHHGNFVPPGQAKKHGHYHHHYAPVYAPAYVYASPPPVVYVPVRPVHHHPQPGVTVVFNID